MQFIGGFSSILSCMGRFAGKEELPARVAPPRMAVTGA